MAYEIIFNARAEEYLASLPSEVAEAIEDALDALELRPVDYESVQFKTVFLVSVAGHDIAWTYSKRENELIVASIRPVA
jgi:mRNA-degrading endonuclease RelE of RelBE toxin-antitoxin system